MKNLSQVKKEALSIINEPLSSRFVDLGNGWYSTCETKPEQGGLYKHLEEPVLVSFVDKYRKLNNGYLYGFEILDGKMVAIVVIADNSGIITSGFINCIVGIKHLKSETKIKAPVFQIKPEFELIFQQYAEHRQKISNVVDKMMIYPSPSNYKELEGELDQLHKMTANRSYIS